MVHFLADLAIFGYFGLLGYHGHFVPNFCQNLFSVIDWKVLIILFPTTCYNIIVNKISQNPFILTEFMRWNLECVWRVWSLETTTICDQSNINQSILDFNKWTFQRFCQITNFSDWGFSKLENVYVTILDPIRNMHGI